MVYVKKNILNSFAAGIMISIGGTVYLSCSDKAVGAVLFSVALLCICYKEYLLFTGKVGYIVFDYGKSDILNLALGLTGNLISTFICGILIRYAIPALQGRAFNICLLKLEQTLFSAFLKALFCGVLMYMAVSIYKEKNSIWGILFCIPVFILSGFEHSVANMFYFSLSGVLTIETAAYILIIVLGNAAGSILMSSIQKYLNK